MRVALDGGEPLRIAELPGASTRGIAWGKEIVVASGTGLWTVPSGGGALTLLAAEALTRGEVAPRWPVVLDDEETILYAAPSRAGSACNARIGLASLRTRSARTLDVTGQTPLGVVAGVLVYKVNGARVGGAIEGITFDTRTGRTRGSARPLLDGVWANGAYVAPFAALSRSGTLMYRGAGLRAVIEQILVSRDNGTTQVLQSAGDARTEVIADDPLFYVRYSPDGKRIAAVKRGEGCETNIWIKDVAAGVWTPLSRGDGFRDDRPDWSRDSKFVVFLRESPTKNELWIQPADGSAPATRLQAGDTATPEPYGGVMSPDGKYLVFRTEPQVNLGSDLMYRALSGDTTARPLAANPNYREGQPSISPDSRWIAYISDISSSPAFDVYVMPFPGPGPSVRVSPNGGDTPMWAPDSHKLYYMSAGRIMEAALDVRAGIHAAPPRELFRTDLDCGVGALGYRRCDISPDGSHFIGNRRVRAATPGPVWLMHNWSAQLRAAPAGK